MTVLREVTIIAVLGVGIPIAAPDTKDQVPLLFLLNRSSPISWISVTSENGVGKSLFEYLDHSQRKLFGRALK